MTGFYRSTVREIGEMLMHLRRLLIPCVGGAGMMLFVAAPVVAGPFPLPGSASPGAGARVRAERTGSLPTQEGMRLVLSADAGNVHIFTDARREVEYRVRIEALANDPAAEKLLSKFSLAARIVDSGVELTGRMSRQDDAERVWITYEVHVPRRYNMDVQTGAGDVVVAEDLDGRLTLRTGGGNIRVGRVWASDKATTVAVRLETAGGHILIGDVVGGLRAETTGGHITAGNVRGDVLLQSGGGHIHVGRVSGAAQLVTAGGNIVAERAESGVVAKTAGGRIEFGEAAGAIHAQTGGGGIRIARVAGPTVLDSSEGGIFLAGVEAPLRASTSAGTITAWFSPLFGEGRSESRTPSDRDRSELAASQGDIIVYLPREMAITIDALVEHGADHRIVADPALPLEVSYEESAGGRAVRGRCALNGGGEVLRLKTSAGNIQLRYLDPADERRLAERQMELVGQRLETQKALLLEMEQQIAEALAAEARVSAATPKSGGSTEAGAASAGEPTGGNTGGASSRLADFARALETFWFGGVRVGPEEQQRRLIRPVIPRYPDLARQAGIEGDVMLRVVIASDGAVSDVNVLSGSPVLGRAAIDAVQQWRYRPAMINGRATAVVTTVTVAFRLER